MSGDIDVDEPCDYCTRNDCRGCAFSEGLEDTDEEFDEG